MNGGHQPDLSSLTCKAKEKYIRSLLAIGNRQDYCPFNETCLYEGLPQSGSVISSTIFYSKWNVQFLSIIPCVIFPGKTWTKVYLLHVEHWWQTKKKMILSLNSEILRGLGSHKHKWFEHSFIFNKHLKKLEDTYWGSLHGSRASLPMGGPPLSRDFTFLITREMDYESSKF